MASNEYTKTDIDIGLTLNADKLNTYLQYDIDVVVSILQSGNYIRFLLNAVDINGKVKMNATSNDILKLQKVDGSTLYDALDLPFNYVDKIIKN